MVVTDIYAQPPAPKLTPGEIETIETNSEKERIDENTKKHSVCLCCGKKDCDKRASKKNVDKAYLKTFIMTLVDEAVDDIKNADVVISRYRRKEGKYSETVLHKIIGVHRATPFVGTISRMQEKNLGETADVRIFVTEEIVKMAKMIVARGLSSDDKEKRINDLVETMLINIRGSSVVTKIVGKPVDLLFSDSGKYFNIKSILKVLFVVFLMVVSIESGCEKLYKSYPKVCGCVTHPIQCASNMTTAGIIPQMFHFGIPSNKTTAKPINGVPNSSNADVYADVGTEKGNNFTLGDLKYILVMIFVLLCASVYYFCVNKKMCTRKSQVDNITEDTQEEDETKSTTTSERRTSYRNVTTSGGSQVKQ